MKKARVETQEVEELQSNQSKTNEVFPSDAFDDFIQEEARLRESEAMVPRDITPKPTLTLTLDKNSEFMSQQLQDTPCGDSEAARRRSLEAKRESDSANAAICFAEDFGREKNPAAGLEDGH